MRVGFTGTRGRVTDFQERRLLELFVFLKEKGAEGLHHGDCAGADELAHSLAVRAGFDWIYIHPPTDGKHQAHCDINGACPPKGITIGEKKPYLTRNHDIVTVCPILVAMPKSDEILRSGTWATVRHARSQGKTIYLIYPFRVEIENDPYGWQPSERFPDPWGKA